MSRNKVFEPYPWKNIIKRPVIGVDEVGRGCLAGRVYAAAVILDETKDLSALTDSKKLSESRRSFLSKQILNEHQCGIGFASVEEIDQINILQAALVAMKRAIEALGVESGFVLVDGNQKIPGLNQVFEQECVVKGDLRAAPIAAASIVAKVARDTYITELGEKYPQYGFAGHKGYSTKSHKEAIRVHGPCSIHRKTFAGVKEFWSESTI